MKMNKLVQKRIFATALSVAMVASAVPETAAAKTTSTDDGSTSYTDEAYIDVIAKNVAVDSVAVEAETDINTYGLGTVSANLSSKSGDEVTNTEITWTSSDSTVLKFYDSSNNKFVDEITTDKETSVQFYGVAAGTATITATSGDGPSATTKTITVEENSKEWNSTVAGVLVNTDTQSGKSGAWNGMVIDTKTYNNTNSKTGKCGMKAGATKGMQTRNTILSIPASEDAKITVELYEAPVTVATSNDGTNNWAGLVADGKKISWDEEACAYIVGFDYETQAVKGTDMQVSLDELTTGDGSVKEFADSYAQLVFGSDDTYIKSIKVETGSGISYSYDAAAEYDASISMEDTDDATLDLNGETSLTRAASVTGTDAENLTVTYSSDNTSVATVDSDGKVTAVGVGYATITAKIPADTDASSFKSVSYVVCVKDTSDVADSYKISLTKIVTPAVKGDYDLGIVKGENCYWNDASHGWCFYSGSTISFKVNGPSVITVGGCKYGKEGELTLTDGENTITGSYSTACDGYTTFNWDGDEAATLTLSFSSEKAYVPYITVEAASSTDEKETSVTWDFQNASTNLISIKGSTGTVKGSSSSVLLTVDATNGKLEQRAQGDAQFNAGTRISVPVEEGAKVTVVSYPGYHNYTIAGEAATEDTTTYTATEAGNVDIVATGNSYLYSITLEYADDDSQSSNEKDDTVSDEGTEASTEEGSESSTTEEATEASTEVSTEASTEASTEVSGEEGSEAESENKSVSYVFNALTESDIEILEVSGTEAQFTGEVTLSNGAKVYEEKVKKFKVQNNTLKYNGAISSNMTSELESIDVSKMALYVSVPNKVDGNVKLTGKVSASKDKSGKYYVSICNQDGKILGTESAEISNGGDISLEADVESTDTTLYVVTNRTVGGGAFDLYDLTITPTSLTSTDTSSSDKLTTASFSAASLVKSAVSSVVSFLTSSLAKTTDSSTLTTESDEVAETSSASSTAKAEGVTDAYIALKFDSTPELTESTSLAAHIYDKSTGKEVDTIYSNEGESASAASYYTGASSTSGTIGKIAVKDNLIDVEDDKLVITPHNDEDGYPVLENGKEYYVTLDDGLVSGQLNGSKITAISDSTTFTFKTSNTTEITDGTIDVNHDGSGDFYTIEGALNYLRKSGASGSWAINVAEGTYHERLFYSGDADITLDGADGKANDYGEKVQVEWKNVDDYGSGGARSRSTFLVQGTGDLVIKDISFTNTYSRTNDGDDGSTQAETLAFDSSGELAVYNSSFYSHQDTLYIGKKGTRAWFYNDYIEGDVDYIWGYADVALFENCKLKCVADEKKVSYIFASRSYTDVDANKGFVLYNSEVEIPEGMTAYYGRNSGSDTQASVINNSFTGDGTLAASLYYSAPSQYVTDVAGDLAIGYKDYNNTMNGTAVSTDGRLSKCGAVSERVANREYNGRYVILNRGYDESDEKYETAADKWEIDSYESDFGASKDISEGNIFIEPVAVKNVIGGKSVTLSANDINGNDITNKVTWKYDDANAGIIGTAENGVFTTVAGKEGRVTVTALYTSSSDRVAADETDSSKSSESTDSTDNGKSSESADSTDKSSEATDESGSTDSGEGSEVSDNEVSDEENTASSVSYNGRTCLADGTVIDGVKVENNAVNGYMVSENVAAGGLNLAINYYDGMAYRGGVTAPSVVAINGTVIFEDGNVIKNAEIADGVVVKNVKFINNKGAYLSDNQTYQSKAGKAPRIIIRLAAKDKSAKSLAKAANKVLRNSEAMQFEIEPLDVQSIINGDSLYSGYSVTVKNAKVKVSIPKYKNGSALIGKTSKKTLRLSSDYTVNSDGTYNFMKNFKGTNITIK